MGDKGVKGSYGPNDIAYACLHARRAASALRKAASHMVYGYMPEPLRTLEPDHPLLKAMEALIEFDKETAEYANCDHEPPLFSVVTGHDPQRDRAVSRETQEHIERLSAEDEARRKSS